MLQEYGKSPKPLREAFVDAKNLLQNTPELMKGYSQFLCECFPEQWQHMVDKETEQINAHRIACQTQRGSQLLELPRELRDKIWAEALIGNVHHVFPVKTGTPRGPQNNCNEFRFHLGRCSAPNAIHSSACPPGVGDHANCIASGSSQVSDMRRVCKQMNLELAMIGGSMFSRDVFQFADLQVAEQFLFGLTEPQRAAITHLKFAIPSPLITGCSDDNSVYESWVSICNYFSNPWDRACVC